ncbi:MAG: efflux RND transporter periplasmic adaptor subunit [Verrucomicrobiota bacterium]|nr:efflux RND transporter periplasmic adaptor subunit [Verrucomicrobiota bacterium]
MKPKAIIIGIIVVLCAGLGVYFLVKSRSAASSSDEESAGENVPTVVSVQAGTLQRRTLHRYVSGYGTVEPAPATPDRPAADAPLAAPSAGVVAEVNVAEGERVKKGEALMTLNSGAMTAAYAESELARQKKLFAEHNTSLKALQDAETQLALLRVISPLAGTVVRLNVKPGAAVDASTVVAEVMDLKRLVVKTDVPASQAGQLDLGQEMEVLTEPPATAPLAYVSPTVNTNNGTVRTWAALPPDSGLRPGQFVSLRIVTAVHTNCLAAPEESVVTDVKEHSVISLVHGDEAIQTPVQTGFRENGWVEVDGNGLKAGDSVVTVGAYGLPEKTKIQVVKP